MSNMPTTSDAFDNSCSSGDFYMAVYDENMTMLEYATFFGGSSSHEHVDGGTSRFDKKGVIYQSVCAGCGGLDDFPISSADVVSDTNGTSTGCNNGVFKFDFQLPLTAANFDCTPSDCIGNTTSFVNTSAGADSYLWNFGDGATSTEENPSHLYAAAGTYTITLTVLSSTTCNGIDSTQRTITITTPEQITLENTVVCGEENYVLSVPSNEGTFSWSPTEGLSNPNSSSTTYSGNESQNFTVTQNNAGCITTYELQVDILKFTALTNDTLLCFPASIALTAGFEPEGAAITWSDTNNWGSNNLLNADSTDADIDISVDESATYYVQISLQGCSIEDSVEVILANDSVLLAADFISCPNDTVSINVQNPFATSTYSWTPINAILSGQNSASITAIISATTEFVVNSVSENGCITSDSIIVAVSSFDQENIFVTPDTLLCEPAEILLQVLNTPTDATISWSDNNNWGSNFLLNDDSTDADIIVQATNSQVYFVQVVSDGCIFEENVAIELANDQTSLAADTLICFEDTLEISVEQPSQNLTYTWSPAELIISGQNTAHVVADISETTVITVSSISEEGCESEDSFTVFVSNLDSSIVTANANPAVILSGTSSQLNASPSGFEYAWSPTTSLSSSTIANPIATPVETTLYTVTVTDRSCLFSDTVTVKVLEVVCAPPNIYVPNAFTPNRDNRNEKVFVHGVTIQEMEFKIFNRWGELVFETTDQKIGWDGTFKGREVDPEVFVYYLEAICIGGENYFEKGNITVIR
jgi:gliding motility-associated-like protein